MSVLKEIYSELIAEGVIQGDNSGCTDSEIEELEKKYNLVLPESYKEFLKLCGHSCEVFDDNEFNYKYKYIECMTEQMLHDRKELIQEAEEGEKYNSFPEKIFFIIDRYGDEFNYIIADGGLDTPVYFHNYPKDTFVKVFDSVGEWFRAHAFDMKKFRDQGL